MFQSRYKPRAAKVRESGSKAGQEKSKQKVSQRPGCLLRHMRCFQQVIKNTTDSKQFIGGKERFLPVGLFHLSQNRSLSLGVLLPLHVQVASLGPLGQLLGMLRQMAHHPLTMWVVGGVEPLWSSGLGIGAGCTVDSLLAPKFTPGKVKTTTSSRGWGDDQGQNSTKAFHEQGAKGWERDEAE